MKVLVIIPFIPYPLYDGASVRIFNILKRISKYCEITLICRADNKAMENSEYLKAFCRDIHVLPQRSANSLFQRIASYCRITQWAQNISKIKMLLKGIPFSIARFYSLAVSKKIRDLLNKEEFDVIMFECTMMSVYLSDVEHFKRSEKIILVEQDIKYIQKGRSLIYTSWLKKILGAIDYLLLCRYEKGILSRFDHVITVSELDKRKLESLGLDNKAISVIKNGVDIDQFRYREYLDDQKRIIFLGTMKFGANRDGLTWFLEDIFPSIEKEVPGVELVIIGNKDPYLCQKYSSPQIVFRGIVEKLESELGNGRIFIAPLRIGGGSRLKIVTAMAFGMPIVATSIGIEGIEINERCGVVIADSPKKFAQAVIALLINRDKAITLGKEARKFVELNYSWEPISNNLLNLLERVTGKNSAKIY